MHMQELFWCPCFRGILKEGIHLTQSHEKSIHSCNPLLQNLLSTINKMALFSRVGIKIITTLFCFYCLKISVIEASGNEGD